MKAALVHLATRATPEATLKAALSLLEQAAQEGAQLALLPELFPSGYRYPDAAATPQVLEALQTSARQHQMVIVAGVLETAADRYANRVRILGPQGELGCYTKTHLIPAFGEPQTMIPGQELVRLELQGFLAGVAICFDLRFPELFRTYAVGGVNLFLIPSAWPISRSYAWELFCKARAAENQAYLLAVNHAEEPFGAASLAIDPLGMELARLESEGVRVVALDPLYPTRLRTEFPVFPQRRPDLYKL